MLHSSGAAKLVWHSCKGMLAVQDLLQIDGAMMTVLRGFAAGSPGMTLWADPAIMLAHTAVKHLSRKPAPAAIDASLTRALSTALLQAAGQARPCLLLAARTADKAVLRAFRY